MSDDANTAAGNATQQLLRQLTAFNRIARIATEDLELRPMLQRIVDELHQQFGWEFIACVTVDNAADSFVCEALHSDFATDICVGYSRSMGSGVVGQVAQNGQTLDISDARNFPGFVDTLGGTLSELCVPVLHQNRVLAVLNVESRRLNAFEGQRVLLETVADQISGAVRLTSTLAETLRLNSDLREANARLQQLSQIDGLTGLANRRQFDRWLDQAWQTGLTERSALSVLMIDVDHFKSYNDHYGHLLGDDALRRVAQSLQRSCVTLNAQIARYGGEEFVVLLPDCGVEAASEVAHGICRGVVEEELEHCGSPLGVVSVSVGLASSRLSQSVSAQQLLAEADRALYAAKHQGRNRAVSAPS